METLIRDLRYALIAMRRAPALTAALVPAWRAATTDPAVALRE